MAPVKALRFLSADHRTIGTLYFVFAIAAGIIGVALSLLIRLQRDGLGAGYFDSSSAALFSSAHGLVMIFFMMAPALFCGFGNWLVPLVAGAGEMAFPRLGRAGFWLFALAFLLFVMALFPWTGRFGTAAWLVATLHIAALSAVFAAVNFIVTIVIMRMPGMVLSRMPPFLWSMLIASFLMLMCVPVMTGAVTLWLAGQAGPGQGGVLSGLPRLQMMLWFFSHPEMYVLLLPAFGIISHIVAAFTRAPLFAEKAIVSAMALIGLAGFVLWSQNLFGHNGKSDMQAYFHYALPVIGLPTAFIAGCWLVTLWRGRVVWRTPMLWAGGFMFTVGAGMVSAFHLGLSHAFSGPPMVFVSHFHYVVSLGAVFAIFAGWYFWFPKMSGFVLREGTGKLHFWMMFAAVNLIFLPQHFQSFTYDPRSLGGMIMAFAAHARLSTVGAFLAASSVCVFLFGIAEAFARKKPAGEKPWGEGAATLEWQPCAPGRMAQDGKLPAVAGGVMSGKGF